MEDVSLSDRLARGDRGALAAIYELHAGVVLGVALRLLKDRLEAEDVLQETFLEAWRNATRYNKDRADVAGWLITIARSRSIDRLRNRAVVARAAERELLEPQEPSSTPDAEVQAQRERALVREQVAQLPAEQRAVLQLAWNEGLSQLDIAKKTGLPLGTVKTRTRLALQRLSAALGGGRGSAA